MKKLILCCLFTFSMLMSQAQIKVIAHRGFSGIAPENTLAAFQKAIDYGIPYFELDIHKTKDDSVVVIHDSSIDRTSSNGMKGKVSQMTFEELSRARVGYPEKFDSEFKDEKVPTLREALLLAKGKIKVCLEIKVTGAEEQVVALLNELNMKDEVIIFSFLYPALAKIRQLDSDLDILYLMGSADESTIDYAKVINAQAIGVGGGTKLSPEYIRKAHDEGLEVWRWTVDDEKTMKELINLGIDGIISNYPNRVVKLLGQ
ncbi:glycerophosphodiester phosphodiesterase [Roseivirga sp.]|uniref:glycerophosphodiester phosphodiesterase n=1 Tax=Roseivirga sp. TaxID=1964215 RepID=UPI003B52F0F6